jgi:cytochrome P450
MDSSSTHLPALLAGVLAAVYVSSIIYGRVVLYFQRRTFKREHGCQPLTHKFPLKDPFLGIDDILAKMKLSKEHKLLEQGMKNFRKVGSTFSSRAFGHNLIATIEPQNVKTVLSLSFKEYGIAQRQHTLGPLLGYGIFTTDGEPWAHSRAMIRPNFSRDQVGDLAAFERHIQHLFKIIPRDGSTVDLQELFFQFTIDSATEFLFGQSTNTLRNSGVQAGAAEANFAKAFNRAQSACATRARMGLLRNVYRDPAGDEAIRICHEFVDQFVDEAVRYREDIERKGVVKEEKYVFLHELAKSTKDKRRLRDELLNVLLAGRDTTASLLSNMWFMIAKQPEIYAKLRREVEETLHGELPSYEQLRNMKYLKFCMNECKSPLLGRVQL